MIAGGRYAFQIAHPGSPMLRVRYRAGIAVDAHGFPDWVPYARAVVQLPPVSPDLGVDEARVVDVLAANRTVAATGDPLYTDAPAGGGPAGWTWAHLPTLDPDPPRRVALVPIELHGAHRHLGGVSTGSTRWAGYASANPAPAGAGGADRRRRGLGQPGKFPVPTRIHTRLSEEAVEKLETHFGYALPTAYRKYLAEANGGGPHVAVVHVGHGFVADQPFFGVAREDALQDLAYANAWFGDRFTPDFLAVGYVQGGLIAVKVRGGDEGSVWYWDDDDPRATEGDTAVDVCEQLLHRCADDFEVFWHTLCEPPDTLRALAEAANATTVTPDGMGASLPPSRRPPAKATEQP
jgi:hypothetical protein